MASAQVQHDARVIGNLAAGTFHITEVSGFAACARPQRRRVRSLFRRGHGSEDQKNSMRGAGAQKYPMPPRPAALAALLGEVFAS